jgi:hypothetical protein
MRRRNDAVECRAFGRFWRGACPETPHILWGNCVPNHPTLRIGAASGSERGSTWSPLLSARGADLAVALLHLIANRFNSHETHCRSPAPLLIYLGFE